MLSGQHFPTHKSTALWSCKENRSQCFYTFPLKRADKKYKAICVTLFDVNAVSCQGVLVAVVH